MAADIHRTKVPVLLVAGLMVLMCFSIKASAQAGGNSAFRDSVGEDFVIASLLISEPGGALYSRLGHAALHMQCPEHNLDYVFTYEAEDVSSKILTFFAGKLRMGMMALDPESYLASFRDEGRGVKEYRLKLPIEAKRNLWKALDGLLMEGTDLPYDYLHRGCACSTLKVLEKGISPLKFEFGQWSDEYMLSRREIGHKALSSSKWARCFLHLISGGEMDRQCGNADKVITPAQLLDVLSSANVNGVPVISTEPQTLVESGSSISSKRPSPLTVSILVLVLTVVCGIFKIQWMDYLLLAIQSILGLITVYLVCFSSLVCTEWNWLIIPFNPLPLIFWKWRRKWVLPYAIILLVWCAFMTFWPHLLTDWTFVVLTISIVISYIIIFKKNHIVCHE